MKLGISNIAWKKEHDVKVYDLMRKYGYYGLEIAPTRIFPQNPYDHPEEGKDWSLQLYHDYQFMIPSMQSIWFGRKENIFAKEEERQVLLTYTKKAIDFAAKVRCKNLVFGCPRNRNIPSSIDKENIDRIAINFFKELGEYAILRGTVVALEANPPIYNTNYINDTKAAIELIHKVNSDGFKLNLDLGTMIQNRESLDELTDNINLINHVHISEPGLGSIKHREIHKELSNFLNDSKYDRFISIEMGTQEDIGALENSMIYIKEIFG